MARVTRYECDRCGRSSNGDTESWWGIIINNGEFPVPKGVLVTPIGSLDANLPLSAVRHVCGMECALSVVQDAMRSIRHEPARV